MIDHAWEVTLGLKGREIGVLPTFIAEATLYVMAKSAKEACYFAERYLKPVQEMDVYSVSLWGAKEYEQKKTEEDP